MSKGNVSVMCGAAALVATLALASRLDAASATTVEVEAIGQAVIFSGDKVAARDKAIDDALRKAVEQAVGTIVSSETVTKNYQLLSDKIYSQAKGYVKGYKVVTEAERDGSVFEVKIKATVGTDNLRNDVDGIVSLLNAKGMPRVLVMVAEQQVGQASPNYWWGDQSFKTSMDATENAIIDAWQVKGVRFVDRQTLAGKLSAGLTSSAAPDDRVVKELAGKVGAEVVVRGDAVAADQGPVMGTQMRSIQVSVSLRAIRTDTGSIMGTAVVTTAIGHVNPAAGGAQALKQAGKKAADELFDKMIAQWQQESTGATAVKLVVNNAQKTGNIKALSNFISNEVRGVSTVRQRSFSKKVAELEVEIEGSAQDLATELEEKKFPGFAIEIEEVTPNSVTATLTKK